MFLLSKIMPKYNIESAVAECMTNSERGGTIIASWSQSSGGWWHLPTR